MTLSNTTALPIPDDDPAGATSTIVVTNAAGIAASGVTVTIANLQHDYTSDITITLIAMKKIVSGATLVLIWVSQAAFSPHKSFEQLTITSLVVNADVSIVLTNETIQPVSLVGDSAFMQQVSVSLTAGSLRIHSTKKRDFRKRGILYIPAANLRQIVINNCFISKCLV